MIVGPTFIVLDWCCTVEWSLYLPIITKDRCLFMDHKHLVLHYLEAKQSIWIFIYEGAISLTDTGPWLDYMDIRVQIVCHWTSIKFVIPIQTVGFLMSEEQASQANVAFQAAVSPQWELDCQVQWTA